MSLLAWGCVDSEFGCSRAYLVPVTFPSRERRLVGAVDDPLRLVPCRTLVCSHRLRSSRRVTRLGAARRRNRLAADDRRLLICRSSGIVSFATDARSGVLAGAIRYMAAVRGGRKEADRRHGGGANVARRVEHGGGLDGPLRWPRQRRESGKNHDDCAQFLPRGVMTMSLNTVRAVGYVVHEL